MLPILCRVPFPLPPAAHAHLHLKCTPCTFRATHPACAWPPNLTACGFRHRPDFLERPEQQGSLKPLDLAKENLHFHTSSTPQQGGFSCSREGLAAAWIPGRSPHGQQEHLHQPLLLPHHANIAPLLLLELASTHLIL